MKFRLLKIYLYSRIEKLTKQINVLTYSFSAIVHLEKAPITDDRVYIFRGSDWVKKWPLTLPPVRKMCAIPNIPIIGESIIIYFNKTFQ